MASETSSAEGISQRIARIIRERQLQPGDRVPSIRELAEQLGEKPNAVRDGLLYGQSQGIVRVLPRAGAFVSDPAADGACPEARPAADVVPATEAPMADYNVFHLLDARRTVEVELAVRAARNRRLEDLEPIRRTLEQMAAIPELERRANYVELDIRFHTQIARLGGNDVLANFVSGVLRQLREQLEGLSWNSERRRKTDDSHVAIYRALVAGGEMAIRSQMEQHLQSAYDSMLHRICTPPGTPAPGERTAPSSDATIAVG